MTFAAVNLHNHRTEIGFTDRVPSGLLGVTWVYYRVHTRRFLRCRVSPAGERYGCVTVRIQRTVKVTDRDIMLRSAVPWSVGPAWPTPEEFDLQTVLIHEFGHLAGNMGHNASCTVAPMTPSLAPGDWWRSTLDHRVVCRPGARRDARARTHAPRRAPDRQAHLRRRVRRPPLAGRRIAGDEQAASAQLVADLGRPHVLAELRDDRALVGVLDLLAGR